MITFAVSNVRRAERQLPSATLEKSLYARSGRTFEAAACNLPCLVASPAHGFLDAVHTAFDLHYPLVLSPDDIWLCIAQGFAMHLNLHAEVLRNHFVGHEGKTKISVRCDDFVKGSPANDWPAMFAKLSNRIREHVGKKRDLVVADFSTSGIVERAASEIVLFDALQSYFDYELVTRCGIPEITLLGTVEDWMSIRRRASALGEFNLSDWTKVLLPVLDQIVRTAQGEVDQAFWQSFYKWHDASGGPYVTGWINVLFPYIETENISTNRRQAQWNDCLTSWKANIDRTFHGGPPTRDFPAGLSSAPFLWDYFTINIPMLFTGGFVGMSQDPSTGAVRPAIGWAISEE